HCRMLWQRTSCSLMSAVMARWFTQLPGATAAVSVEEGMDKLRLRKADFVVAGGIDDLSIEGITGFGDMAATADSGEMEAKGIDHKYFSRANDRRRGGFI